MNLLCIVTVTMLLGTAAYAQAPDVTQNSNAERQYTSALNAVNGRKTAVNGFFALKPDCSPTDWLEVEISKEPENGTARLVDGTTMPTYTAPNVRVRCNEKSVKTKVLEYVPTKGYKGPDSIVVEATDSSGFHNTYTYNFTVR